MKLIHSINTLFLIFSHYEGRHHINQTSQDAKMLSFRDFEPDKVANVLPDTGMAVQALNGTTLVLVGSGWQRSTQERDNRGVSLSNLF